MDKILKEWVRNAGGRLRLKDALILVQAHEGCSREPAFRKIRSAVNEGYGMLRWDRPSPRKVYIAYHPECDHSSEGTWTPPGPSTEGVNQDAYREKLLRLKAEAFDRGDYQRVKDLRILIKEHDAQQPKEKVQPYRLFEKIER